MPWTPPSDSGLTTKESVEETNYTEGEWLVRGVQMEDSHTGLGFEQSNSLFPAVLFESANDEVL